MKLFGISANRFVFAIFRTARSSITLDNFLIIFFTERKLNVSIEIELAKEMENIVKIMGEKEKHKVKRIYPVLVTDGERSTGIKELSRLEIKSRLQKLYGKRSFVAVSLSSNEFSENPVNQDFWRTEIILEWIAGTFGQTDFLVSDSLYRFYNQILYGYNASRALEKGIADGNKFIENCREKISELGLNRSYFNFIKWSEITNELDFKNPA